MGLKPWVSINAIPPDLQAKRSQRRVLSNRFVHIKRAPGGSLKKYSKSANKALSGSTDIQMCDEMQVSPAVWTISYGIEFVLIALLTAAICCASFFGGTSFSLLFLALLLFTIAELAFGMMVRPDRSLAFLLTAWLPVKPVCYECLRYVCEKP